MVVALLATVAWFLWIAGVGQDRRSADARLAEIEAARTIPDAENAASIYNQLLEDPNATSSIDDLPESVSPETFEHARREPWLSGDLPELAGWVRDHRFIIAKLLDASRWEKCRFPISIDTTDSRHLDRVGPMRWWAYLLAVAANNDVAEGRVDAALMEWSCLLQMDNHCHQHPAGFDHLLGMSVGRLALESMARFLVHGVPAETHLQKLEAMPLAMADSAAEHLKEAHEIERLMEQKLTEKLGPLEHLRYLWMKHTINCATRGIFRNASFNEEAYLYRRSAATARGIRILIALRRFRNVTGRWPESLDEVNPSLPAEILTDPFNQGPFVYQRTSDAFRLYSKGRNNKDEDGKWDPDAGPDDWPIWPLQGRTSNAEPRDANGV
jgi:hypothetical protein